MIKTILRVIALVHTELAAVCDDVFFARLKNTSIQFFYPYQYTSFVFLTDS